MVEVYTFVCAFVNLGMCVARKYSNLNSMHANCHRITIYDRRMFCFSKFLYENGFQLNQNISDRFKKKIKTKGSIDFKFKGRVLDCNANTTKNKTKR